MNKPVLTYCHVMASKTNLPQQFNMQSVNEILIEQFKVNECGYVQLVFRVICGRRGNNFK